MLKKSTALLLVIFMVLMSASTVLQASAAIQGDINADAKVSSADYILVKRHVLGTSTLSSTEMTRADIDGDGDVDRVDVVMVRRILLGTLESKVDTTAKIAVSYAKTYTKSVTPSTSYEDTYDQELTDGHVPTATDYMDDGYVGFESCDFDIIINLESDGTDICAFDVSYLINTGAGIYAPASVTVSGSNSQYGTYTQIINKSFSASGQTSVKTLTLNLTDNVDYTYIKFHFSTNNAWIHLAETTVYAMVEGGSSEDMDYYEADTLTDVYRSNQLASAKSSSTYNASLGMSEVSGTASYTAGGYDTRTGNGLSGGKVAKFVDNADTGSYFASGRFVGLSLSSASSITFTISSTYGRSDICGFELHCFNRPAAAINLPAYVDVSVSTNGRTYYNVGRIYAPDTDQENFVYSLYLDTLVNAKYVTFSAPASWGYMWVEEVNVLANVASSSSTTSYTGYLNSSSSVLGGVEDVLLVYHNAIKADEEMLLPYVAYVDENGNVLDTMYDGYLFLPQVGDMKCTGHTPYGTNCAEDWKWYYDEVFKSGVNLDALNTTAEKIKLLLGKSELKLKVFLTIPHMEHSVTSFGDINGDGTDEVVSNQNGRVNTAILFAKMLMQEFNNQGYENLELCGFYWFHEEIADYNWDGSYSGDASTSKAVTAAMKSQLGMPMFWIPYFQARGYTTPYSFGFEAVCYQPNYAFDLDVDKSRIATAANTASSYGMCIELEVNDGGNVDRRWFQKYMDYLSGGIDYGYMNNALHMYYQSLNVVGAASKSESDRYRLVYDYTYQFIKGTLTKNPSAVGTLSFTTSKNTAFGGSVNTESTDGKLYKLSGSPDHGSIAFAEDGSFVYYPNKSFTGTDTFTYQVGNYLGWSTNCTVTITVN